MPERRSALAACELSAAIDEQLAAAMAPADVSDHHDAEASTSSVADGVGKEVRRAMALSGASQLGYGGG